MTKNIDKQKYFSLSQLRIQTDRGGGVFEGGDWYPNAHYVLGWDDLSVVIQLILCNHYKVI